MSDPDRNPPPLPDRSRKRLAQRGLASVRRIAAEYAEDPQRAADLARQAKEKARERRGRFRRAFDSVMALIRMVLAWSSGRYTGLRPTTVVLALAALIYFVSPLDLIPDFLLGPGLVDDAAVLTLVLSMIRSDLEAFMKWERDEREPA